MGRNFLKMIDAAGKAERSTKGEADEEAVGPGQSAAPASDDAVIDDTSDAQEPAEESPRRPRIRSTRHLSAGLMDMQTNTVRDLDPDAIVSSGLRDRILVDDETIAELADSIRTHGQHVPILVRPLPRQIDRYEVIYGRRRLAAIRRIGGGQKVKAIIRTMPDTDAIIAQGHENHQRLDPSHIEKALFAVELRKQKYDNQVIQDALSVDRFTLARLVKVAEDIPAELIKLIGPAHEIGRRPWRSLGDLVISGKVDVMSVAEDAVAGLEPEAGSSDRFRKVHDALKDAVRAALQQENAAAQQERSGKDVSHGSTSRTVGDKRRGPVLHLQRTPQVLSLSFKTKDNPDFSRWLEERAADVVADLQERWKREAKGD